MAASRPSTRMPSHPARTVSTAGAPTPDFAQLGVPSVLVAALARLGITAPFPIQSATLPDSLAGRDVLGRGRTGSGKTFAFLLPVLARLAASGATRQPGRPRSLVLAPTRELASQIEAAAAPLAATLGLRTLTVFGGVPASRQISGLRAGVDVLIACPGRLEDHIRGGQVRLDAVEVSVLDEADHMAELGFLPSVRRLLDQTPRDGQRLLFSATLDAGVDGLVRRYLTNPITHSVDSDRSPVGTMEHHVLHVRREDRLAVLVDLTAAPGRTLVFTRTKRGAKALARQLVASGVPAVELHGNLAQNARARNLEAFSTGTHPTLVATDIAARGIHVDGITLVVHADPPVEHKAYLHRSGRTARAGASGTVVTLMTDEQVRDVADLTRKAGVSAQTTRIAPGHPLLEVLAPGERSFARVAPVVTAEPVQRSRPGRAQGGPAVRRGVRSGAAAGNPAHPSRSGGAAGNPAHPSRSGGAAAFSAGSRAGRRSAR